MHITILQAGLQQYYIKMTAPPKPPQKPTSLLHHSGSTVTITRLYPINGGDPLIAGPANCLLFMKPVCYRGVVDNKLFPRFPKLKEKPEPDVVEFMVRQGFEGELLSLGFERKFAVDDRGSHLQTIVACIGSG